MFSPKGLKRQWVLLIGGDFAASTAAAYVVFAATGRCDLRLPSSTHCHLAALVLGCVYLATFYFQDLYRIEEPRTSAWVGTSVLSASAKTAVAVGVVMLAVPQLEYGRRFYLVYMGVASSLLLLWRIGLNRLTSTRLNIGVMALGLTECAPMLAEELNRRRHLGYRFLGFAAWDGGSRHEVAAAPLACGFDVHPTSPTASPIDDQTRIQNANILVLLDEAACNGGIRELVRCRVRGIQIFDFESFYERITGKLPIPFLDGSWLLYAPGFVGSRWRRELKRIADVAGAVLIGTVTLPLSVLTAIAIKLDSAGPVLYWQERVGLDERIFWVCKFRSMTVEAEKNTGAVWASERDPRVTRVGRVIRRLRIDELPQLLNVLRGEMSLVGPRPERPQMVAKLAEAIPCYDYRHFVRPGLTGWAQICYPYGASLEDAQQKLAYDLYYLKNWSLTLDLQIVLQTVKVVLFGRGAR